VDKRYAAIVDGNEFIDQVIAFDSTLWRRFFRYGQIFSYLRMSIRNYHDLQSRRFDLVINLTGEKWWAQWFNAAPVRIGLFPRMRPGLMGRLYTKAIPRPANTDHNSDHYLLPALAIGINGPYDRRMSVPLREKESAEVTKFLNSHPDYDRNRPTVLLHPGTSQPSKCWPAEHFAALIDHLKDEYNLLITGSTNEKDIAEKIIALVKDSSAKPISTIGILPDLRHVIALVARSTVVVTGDTSVLHIASALQIPVAAVYGSTRPGDNRPLFGRSSLLFDDALPCAPCYKASCSLTGTEHLGCIRAITPFRVYTELLNLALPTRPASVNEEKA